VGVLKELDNRSSIPHGHRLHVKEFAQEQRWMITGIMEWT